MQTSQQDQGFIFSDTKEEAFDVKSFLMGYLRYWYWFLLSFAICASVAWLYLRYTVPEFEASSKLLIKDGKSDQILSEETVLQDMGLLNTSSNLVNEIQILKSRSLMLQVVENLRINIQYYALGRFKETELYDNLPFEIDSSSLQIAGLIGQKIIINFTESNRFTVSRGEKLIGNYSFGDIIILENGRFRLTTNNISLEDYSFPIAIQFHDPLSTARTYANKLDISRVADRASILNLKLIDYNGAKAAAILDELVEVYNIATIDDKNRVARNTLDFIDERLDFLTLELADVEGDVERYKSNNNIPLELESRAQDVLGRVSQYEQEIAELEIQQDVANSLLSAIRNPEKPYSLLPASLSENSNDLNQGIQDFNQLIIQREQLLKSANKQNPILLTMEGQVEDLRQNIITNLLAYIKILDLSKNRVETKYSDLRLALRNIPKAERELLEKKRQQIIKENLFLYLLQKREETALSLAVAVPNSRIVDSAESTSGPISPIPFNIMALAVFLGLSLPIGGILTKQIFDDKIRSEKDIKDFSSVPIIGAISESGQEEQIVVTPSSRSGVAEMFRLIRTNLRFLSGDKNTTTLLITSGSGGEGKTFISVNLGMSMAISNKRTLLIGLDLRKPKLGSYLNEEDTLHGISNFIIDESLTETDVIRQSAFHKQLDFVTSGPIPPNPAELIMTDRMQQLIHYAQSHYDCVIIDTPPIGLVADAFLLNQYATTSLFVVRAGKTPKKVITMVDDVYQQEKLRHLACIINGVPKEGGYGYGYGYGYGNGYGYYDEDHSKKKWWKVWK